MVGRPDGRLGALICHCLNTLDVIVIIVGLLIIAIVIWMSTW